MNGHMVGAVAKFIGQAFYCFSELSANIRVIAKGPGNRGGIYIKLFRNVFYGNTAQDDTLVLKYREIYAQQPFAQSVANVLFKFRKNNFA